MNFNALSKICTWAALFMLPLLSFADVPQNSLFLKGNMLYAKGQYKEALGTYKQLAGEGYHSAALYFNMGNASFKSDDIASAVFYLEKAHKIAPGDADINYNLKYVNLKTADKIVQVPDFILTQWWHAFILSFSSGTFGAWSIVFVLAGSALLILFFFAGSAQVKRVSFYCSLALFFIGVLALFAANRQISYFEDTPQAVVFSSAVNVKSAPADKATVLFVIHDGTKVEVLDSNNDWTKIGLANGNEGWIKASDIKVI